MSQPPPVKSSPFATDVLKLVTGTTIAQIIAILASPVLTRLLGPDAFGFFALFTSITAIIGVIACMRYELAIMLPKDDEAAANLLALSFLMVAIISGLTAIGLYFGGEIFVTFLQAPGEADINAILAVVSQRVVDAGSSIKYHNAYYQPYAQLSGGLRPKLFAKGTKALVVKAFDGTLLASIKDATYLLREVEKRSSHSKEFDPERPPAPRQRKSSTPAPDHPWRTRFLAPNVLECHIAKPREDYES